jgi:hypothetical protein
MIVGIPDPPMPDGKTKCPTLVSMTSEGDTRASVNRPVSEDRVQSQTDDLKEAKAAAMVKLTNERSNRGRGSGQADK